MFGKPASSPRCQLCAACKLRLQQHSSDLSREDDYDCNFRHVLEPPCDIAMFNLIRTILRPTKEQGRSAQLDVDRQPEIAS